MIWQDILISIASITFSIALIPQVYHGFKEKQGVIKLQTSIPTVLGLFAVMFAFFTLDLYFSTIVSFITGTLWVILVIQRVIYNEVVAKKTGPPHSS